MIDVLWELDSEFVRYFVLSIQFISTTCWFLFETYIIMSEVQFYCYIHRLILILSYYVDCVDYPFTYLQKIDH